MKATPYDIERLIRMLEMGMWDNNLIQSLLDTLDSEPEVFLPNAIGFVNYAAFLLMKVGRHPFGRRMLLASLAWCIESEYESEYGAALVQNIKEISLSEGMELEEEEIRKLAIKRHYGKAESWVTLLDTSDRCLDRNDRYQGSDSFGVIAGVSSKLPLTTFKGWLKRLDPEVLNASGRSLMKEVFSRFGSDFSSPEESLMEAERLLHCGVGLPQKVIQKIDELRHLIDKGLRIVIRRHRRFAGGDGRLPRSCYSSVCLDSQGDDGGTLNRELMAYSHPAIPGGVFVGDSTDTRLNSVLGHPVGVLPGYCALYVLLAAPERNVDKNIFNAVYRETLEHNGGLGAQRYLFIIETRVDYVEIENVIDLRLPSTQKWFLDHFRNGDGAHLIKPNGQKNCDFTSMLPTLMHPEL